MLLTVAYVFQSRPARGPGATRSQLQTTWIAPCRFQSPPGPRAGRYASLNARTERSTRVFQSPPGPRAGRYPRGATASWSKPPRFQSPPGPRAGRYSTGSARPSVHLGFQSPPGPRAGRYSTKPRYRARALDYCRLSGGCHAQRRVPRPRDPQIRPLYGTDSARAAGLRAIAEDSRSCVTQNTNVPRWSNGGPAPNVRRCRASGSRRR